MMRRTKPVELHAFVCNAASRHVDMIQVEHTAQANILQDSHIVNVLQTNAYPSMQSIINISFNLIGSVRHTPCYIHVLVIVKRNNYKKLPISVCDFIKIKMHFAFCQFASADWIVMLG